MCALLASVCTADKQAVSSYIGDRLSIRLAHRRLSGVCVTTVRGGCAIKGATDDTGKQCFVQYAQGSVAHLHNLHGAVIDNDISISLYPAAINDLTDKPLPAVACGLWQQCTISGCLGSRCV